MMSVRLIIAAFMAFCAVSAVAQSSNSTNSSLSSSSSTGVDSSSSSVIISSSSTGGGQGSVTYPDNSWQVSYILSLTTSNVPSTLPNAVTEDFVRTIMSSLNMTFEALRPYCTSTITIPSVQASVVAMAAGNTNVTATSVVMGNLTGNAQGSPEVAANTFKDALAAGTTSQSSLQAVDAGAAVPVQTATVQKAPNAPNGAASVASATLLVGSMIAAVMLML